MKEEHLRIGLGCYIPHKERSAMRGKDEIDPTRMSSLTSLIESLPVSVPGDKDKTNESRCCDTHA